MDASDPEREALIGDAVGMALQVVIDTLTPAERIAFVLHDVFGMPFEDIAPIVGRTPAAARQLASRARRRVRGAPVPDVTLDEQWAVVRAFLAAAREGDVERLVSLLDPEVVLHSDGGTARPGLVSVLRGVEEVAAGAMTFRRFAGNATPVLVNGTPGGIAWTADGRPFAILAMTVRGGRIVEIDVLADPARLGAMDLRGFEAGPPWADRHIRRAVAGLQCDEPTTVAGGHTMTDRSIAVPAPGPAGAPHHPAAEPLRQGHAEGRRAPRDQRPRDHAGARLGPAAHDTARHHRGRWPALAVVALGRRPVGQEPARRAAAPPSPPGARARR